MRQDLVEQVRALAGRVAGSYGLDIFDVQFRREGQGLVLRVQVDRPGPSATATESVSVDDCARISRDLSAILDVEDLVPDAYTLEVSSPGLDRPIRTLEAVERFAGHRVALTTHEAHDGRRNWDGTLAGPDGTRVGVKMEQGERWFEWADVKTARLIVDPWAEARKRLAPRT